MLQLGRGAPRGFEEAGRWYRAAAEQGHSEAMVNLAVLLANGFGVERDAVEAYAWLARAARMADEKLAARAEALRADLAGRLGEKEAGRAAELAASFVPKPNKTTLITRGEGRPQPRGVGGFGELWLAAQRYLALLGLYDGAVDGAAGPKARAAVLSFVRRGAPKAKTATLSPELLARLAFAWEASTTAPAAP
jgi:TPR repeat protein